MPFAHPSLFQLLEQIQKIVRNVFFQRALVDRLERITDQMRPATIGQNILHRSIGCAMRGGRGIGWLIIFITLHDPATPFVEPSSCHAT